MKENDLKRLIEECAEVIQAASKIMRFGLKGSYCDGRKNLDVLTTEVGDLIACINNLQLDERDLQQAVLNKQRKLRRIAEYELGFDCDLTREQREALHQPQNIKQAV